MRSRSRYLLVEWDGDDALAAEQLLEAAAEALMALLAQNNCSVSMGPGADIEHCVYGNEGKSWP